MNRVGDLYHSDDVLDITLEARPVGRLCNLEQLVEVLTFEGGLERTYLVAHTALLYDPYGPIDHGQSIISERQHLHRDISCSRRHE